MKTQYFLTVLILISITILFFKNKLTKKDSAFIKLGEPYRTAILVVILASVCIILTNIYDPTYLNVSLIKIARTVNLFFLIFVVYAIWKSKRQ
jgi:hypothetical protein